MFGSRLEVKRFEDKVLRYEAVPVETGKILFYGHSLFTRCSFITKQTENPILEDAVRMKDGSKAIVNHGFGTSSADDLLYYYDRLVRPYKPRALVLATASNDIGFGYSAKEIMEILARVINWAHADFPDIPIYCFSSLPSIKRKGTEDVMTRVVSEYNSLLKAFCDNEPNCTYVSLADQAFYYENAADIGDRNKIREDIFVDDGVHLNPKGYALFFDFVRELLDDLL